MGQRQNETEIVYGNDCLIGFPEGKTPKYLYVRFSKMVKCPAGDYQPPNDRVFKLTQSDVVPCSWFDVFDNWEVSFNIWTGPVRSNVYLHNDSDGLDYFSDVLEGPVKEGSVHHNEIVACNEVFGAKDGIAVVTWKLESLKVMGLLNIKPQKDLFMEMRPREDGARIYKYCKIEQGMNIAIEYDPD